jgi:hypothetical protein
VSVIAIFQQLRWAARAVESSAEGYNSSCTMEGQKKEPWMELCAQAAVEQDPDKLHALVDEVPRLLQEDDDQRRRRKVATLN